MRIYKHIVIYTCTRLCITCYLGYKVIYCINIDCCISYTQSFFICMQITSYCILLQKTNNFIENYGCIWTRFLYIAFIIR